MVSKSVMITNDSTESDPLCKHPTGLLRGRRRLHEKSGRIRVKQKPFGGEVVHTRLHEEEAVVFDQFNNGQHS